MMKNITVIGAGHVGLVTGTCFADLGNTVICLDDDEAKVKMLKAGEMPLYEPGLAEMVARNVAAERLSFTSSYPEGIAKAEFVFVAVGTPEGVDGEADVRRVRMAAQAVAELLDHRLIIVNKSTVPVGTGDWVAEIVDRFKHHDAPYAVVSNPEFLREGSAVADFMHPDRIVLGSTDRAAAEEVAQLYATLRAPVMITDLRTAEMIKYASNAFLATRISFINEIAHICEAQGADVKEVAIGMGYDRRIGPQFLDPGVGYGGSCFPKDLNALIHMGDVHGQYPHILRAVVETNNHQRHLVIQKLRSLLGSLHDRRIGLLGLSFKPNTNDMRDSPALEIAHLLINEGASVRGYDPVANETAKRLMPDVQLASDPYELAKGCDALVILTAWNEFKSLDMRRLRKLMRRPIMVDGRNIYEPDFMRSLGFIYYGMGRGS